MASGDINRLAGVLGLGSQTPAVQAMLPGRTRRKRKKTTRKKRTRRAAPRRTTRKRTSRAKKKPARLVKGSAAAKRHMAKLRAMRR